MKIKAIETFSVKLPFRFAFGHSLATRCDSTNLIVRVTLEDGTQGHGEGIPRQYVTGEVIEQAERTVQNEYVQRFIGLEIDDLQLLKRVLQANFYDLKLHKQPNGASWCALELAILDAACQAHQIHASQALAPVISPRIRYGGVIPFGGKRAVTGMLAAYKLLGFATVKIKVGKDLDEDLQAVALARRIMGDAVTLRVDANCAWNLESTLRAAEAFRPYRVASYEQPVPADRLDWLQRITNALPEQVLADESLCTIEQAQHLAAQRICSAFNVRISKVGGLLAAGEIVAIAAQHGIACHLGAQVGESGILSAAARVFAACNKPFANYEGSMNRVLLKRDVVSENLTVGWGGYADLGYARSQRFGFGFSISAGTLESLDAAEDTSRLAGTVVAGHEPVAPLVAASAHSPAVQPAFGKPS
jgi:muconate cycloisomerase